MILVSTTWVFFFFFFFIIINNSPTGKIIQLAIASTYFLTVLELCLTGKGKTEFGKPASRLFLKSNGKTMTSELRVATGRKQGKKAQKIKTIQELFELGW